MDYIQITKENIDKEHICCAMSGKQSLAKKEWLKQRFAEGLVFYRSVDRVHPGRKRMGAHYSGRLAVHQLPVGLRFHERARLLK